MLPTTLKALVAAALLSKSAAQNVSTFNNPILPGFHPDPTCTFVAELNSTFFCTFSSFLTFPGLPIVASRDLVNWKHISNALSRPEQIPSLAFLQRGATSGIYAPTLRYHDGTFYILTTTANQALYPTNYTKWDNFILTSTDPYSSSSWSDPIQFDFPGIDPSPFWDDDGQVHMQGSFDGKSILQAPIDLTTGEVTGPLTPIWNGTGLPSPEAPHMYKKDGWYYLLTAEGGTRERHRANMARSRNLYGPFVGAPSNPLLSAYLSESYFQAVGHADIFPDSQGNFWAIALGVRAGYSYNFDPYNSIFPMGREGLLIPVHWPTGEYPTFMNVSGTMSGKFNLSQPPGEQTLPTRGEGYSPSGNDIINFEPGSTLPPHLFHWRLPVSKNYAISPAGDGNFDRTNSLMLRSSVLNLTAFDADSTRGRGQTFLARKQAHTRFRYSVDVTWASLTRLENEVGVTALQDQAQHFDLGVVMLQSTNGSGLEPHLRFRGISTTTYRLPERFKYVNNATPLSSAMRSASKLRLQVEALNTTHYAFSAGSVGDDADADVDMTVMGYAKGNNLIPYYSGVVVGVYATSNGKYGEGAFETFVSRWRYTGLEQVRVLPADQGPVTWD
jgi:beta-xylosidase